MAHAEEYVCERIKDVNNKTVLLIGDSSCMGYREFVKNQLFGDYSVVYPEENARCSQYTLIMLRSWSGLCDGKNVVAVQFNNGHWDVAHWNDEDVSLNTPEVYAENLVRIARALKKYYPNAKLIFATTMPMNPNGENSINFRYTYEIEKYNKAATDALKNEGVYINDLFSEAKGFTPDDYADYCHLKDNANEKIASHVSEYIKNILKEQ